MKTLAFFTVFDGIMWGRKVNAKTSAPYLLCLARPACYTTWDFWQRWFEGRMAQCLTDILCGRATAAAMVTLAAAYLAVTLLVQEARFVKRFYVRCLTNNGAIDFNGYTITLADGTVLR